MSPTTVDLIASRSLVDFLSSINSLSTLILITATRMPSTILLVLPVQRSCSLPNLLHSFYGWWNIHSSFFRRLSLTSLLTLFPLMALGATVPRLHRPPTRSTVVALAIRRYVAMLVNALDLPTFASCPHRLLFFFFGRCLRPICWRLYWSTAVHMNLSISSCVYLLYSQRGDAGGDGIMGCFEFLNEDCIPEVRCCRAGTLHPRW